MKRLITIHVEVEGGDDAFPSPEMLAQGIYDGLPEEWYDYQDDDDYKIVNIVGQFTSWNRWLKDNAMMQAELDQELKLTAHLERKIQLIDAEVGRMEQQTDNLIEKNDNQRDIIVDLEDRLIEFTKRSSEKLAAWDKAYTEKNQQLIEGRKRENGLKETIRDYVTELKKVRVLRDKHATKSSRLRVDLLTANEDAQKNALMIGVIVNAMEEAGYEITSGWGNDTDLEELERRATDIEDAAAKIEVASSELNASSIDLDAKLDNIRTER